MSAETKHTPLDKQEAFLLDWLSKEDSSSYGECRGITLDSLCSKGLASIKPARNGQDENYARVSVTSAGRAALAKAGAQPTKTETDG